MRKLYIVGNGFDLYHGMETSYNSFGLFLNNANLTIYDYLIEYYSLPDIANGDEGDNGNTLWSEFESALADLDYETVLDNNSDYLAKPSSAEFRDRDWHAFQIEMENIVGDLTKNLFEVFRNFILKVKYPNLIDIDKLPLETNALYFTFNYTETLEKLYKIREGNILYIHEKASDNQTGLILGHGIDPKKFIQEDPKPPEDLSYDERERWIEDMSDNYDFSYESGKDELLNYFSNSYKDTESIINTNEDFFKNIKDVVKVEILGHSLSAIDLPYFSKIFKSVHKNSDWLVTFYNPRERSAHKEALMSIGIKESNIRLIQMDNLVN